jgi:hypothetical protein
MQCDVAYLVLNPLDKFNPWFSVLMITYLNTSNVSKHKEK